VTMAVWRERPGSLGSLGFWALTCGVVATLPTAIPASRIRVLICRNH